jgi:UDP-GlcNAc:undecaprenyl-phosphate GlcNAc-1-phosphate transferase
MTILVMIIAFSFALFVTPIVRQLALRLHFVAVPRGNRAHQTVTPMMGGVALYIGFSAAILSLALALEAIDPNTTLDSLSIGDLFIVFGCGTIMAVVGLWDDWKDLNSKLKLLLQVLPVAVLIAFTDIQIQMPVPDILNIIVTFLWYLYVINALNYMDNMDGVAGMTSTVAAMFFTVVAIINEQYLLAALAAGIAGVSFGFLRHNLFETERKIFMGDVGSLFLGFLLATVGLTLTFEAESPWVTWPVPVLILGVPIFDTALVFISRWRRGQSFLDGGTDHLSHRFSRLGFGRFGVPFAIGLLGSLLGAIAILIMHSSLGDSLAAQVFVALCAFYMLYRLELTAPYTFITGKFPPGEEPEETKTPPDNEPVLADSGENKSISD